ncbi:MAG: hypothetical protein KBT68_11285 [bacterium]|nr:hypothetical protein [Candidatus Colisoma equi]
MKRLGLFIALCVTLCLTGCMSTEVSKSEVCGTEHIFVSDFGWKLFNWIPIFRSDITLERVQKELMSESTRRGKVATDLTVHTYDTVTFDIPLVVITIPIPYIICYHEIQVSGVLK